MYIATVSKNFVLVIFLLNINKLSILFIA